MKIDPPTRLRDDPTVSPTLRDDLTRAASSNLSGYDVAAGLARFEASIQPGGPGHDGGPPGSGGAPAPAGVSAGAKALLAPALKGALAGVVAIGLAAAVSARRPSAPERAAPPAVLTMPAAPTAITPSRIDPPEAPPSALPEDAPPTPPPPSPARTAAPPRTAPEPANPPAASADQRAVAPADPLPAGPAPVSGPDALAQEMENLTRLRALESADPAGAVAIAAEGQRRFPGGLFAQEREAIAIRALARLGRTAEARARAEAFLAAYPKSAFAEGLRRLTGAGEAR